MKCESIVEELIESTDDISYMDRVVSGAAYARDLQAGIMRARRTGKYTVPSRRISQYLDYGTELVGTSLMLDSTSRNTREFVPVKTAEMVGSQIVSVNNGQYIVDLREGMTTNGQYYVQVDNKMGSSSKKEFKGNTANEISGTVLQNIEEIVNLAKAEDGTKLDPVFKEYLDNIFTMYQDILLESGKDVPINVKFIKALDDVQLTEGDASIHSGKIRLLMGNTRYRTNTEVLAEEMQHVLIKEAANKNPMIAEEILALREGLVKEFNEKYNGEGHKIFLEGIENPTHTDEMVAKEQWDYAFANEEYAVEEFLAHATTNQAMVKALGLVANTKNIELISKVDEKGRAWAKIWNQIVDMVNSIYAEIKLNKENTHTYAVKLLHKLLEMEHRVDRSKDKSRYEKLLNKLASADAKIADYTGALGTHYNSYQEYIDGTKQGSAKKIMNKIWNIRGLAKARSFALQNNIFSGLTKNMKNPDIAKFYELFRHSKEFVEKEVVAVKRLTADLLHETYGLKDIDLGSRKASKRVLVDADAKALGDSKEIAKYLKDEKLLTAEIDELSAEFSKTVIQDVDNTAELMINNHSNSVNVYVNANQIAFDRVTGYDKDTVSRLDRLITLRAIQKLPAQDRAMTLAALEKNPVAFNKTMELMREEQAQMLDKAYKSNPMYVVKGAKQEQYLKDMKRYIVDENEMKLLEKAKIYNLGKDLELSALIGKPVYIMMGESLDTQYSEGLLKVVQLSNEGDSLKHLMMKLGDLSEKDTEVRLEMLRQRKVHAKTQLVPERTGRGEIYDYRVRIQYEEKAKYMTLDDDIVATVAGTVANLTHKQEAMLSNYAAVNYLRRFHEMYKGNPEHKFMEIGPKSTGKQKEYWDMIPYYIKTQIEKSGEPLRVTESMITDFFGYHDASIINLPWIKDSKKRQLIARKTEKVIQELVRRWKLIIVAFLVDTVKVNNLSNMAVALHYTSYKNPLTYLNNFRKSWSAMNDYEKGRKQKIMLEVRQKAGEKGLEKEIKAVDARLKASPLHQLIEDGQYSVIFEDLNTSYFDNEGVIEEKVNEMLKKAEGKNGKNLLKTLVDTVYLRKKTLVHNTIMKATTYSDLMMKNNILMDFGQQAQNMKADGLSMEEIGKLLQGAKKEEVAEYLKTGMYPKTWLNFVDGLTVNYGYLDNKYIKYANDLGFLTFTKYTFRVLPAMAKMVATKGLTVGLTETAQKLTGVDAETPLDQFFDPFGTLGAKVGLYTRIEDWFKTIVFGPIVKNFQ